MNKQINEPKVCIGITTYNSINTIEKCIESAIKQTWKNIEIIVVDDCSIDKTQEKIKKLAIIHKNIRFFFNKFNRGVAFSRNVILKNTTAEYTCFFDDDDISEINRIKEQYLSIINYQKKFKKDYVISHSAKKKIFPDGKFIYEKTLMDKSKLECDLINVRKAIFKGSYNKNYKGACATSSQMASNKTYNHLNNFDINFKRGEDTDLIIKSTFKNVHIIGIDKALVIQIMTKTKDKNLENEYYYNQLILEKYKKYLKEINYYYFLKKWINLKFIFLRKNYIYFIFQLIFISLLYPIKTIEKILYSIPNIKLNYLFSNFYK